MDCKYKSQSGEIEFCKAMLEVRKCVVVGQSCELNVLLSHNTTKCEILERGKKIHLSYYFPTIISFTIFNTIFLIILINNILKMELDSFLFK